MRAMTVAAKRYAKALFAVAQEKGAIEETQAQLSALALALESNADVQAFFEHPNIGTDAKLRVLKEAVSGKVSDVVLNTVQLLVERGRGSALPQVHEAFTAIANEALGRASGVVTSAFALDAAQQEEIARQFSALTGKKITLETVVDASLLGGVRVRIGDTLYDGSLATKLSDLEKSFNQAR